MIYAVVAHHTVCHKQLWDEEVAMCAKIRLFLLFIYDNVYFREKNFLLPPFFPIFANSQSALGHLNRPILLCPFALPLQQHFTWI